MAATWTIKSVTAEWSSKTEIGKRTGTAVYQCVASEPSTPIAAEIALVASGKGAIGSEYPDTTNVMRCTSRDCRGDPTRMIFRVTCEFDSTVTINANPLSDPPAFEYAGESNDEAYFAETQEPPKKATTTAGEPFPELPTRTATIVAISMTRNVAAGSTYATYFPFANKLNSGSVTIDGLAYTDGQVLVGAPALSEVKRRDGYGYRVLSVKLRARSDGWDQKYESRGLYELSGGILRPIADAEGVPVETPWPLNASGAKLSSASTSGAEIVLKPYVRTSLTPLVS